MCNRGVKHQKEGDRRRGREIEGEKEREMEGDRQREAMDAIMEENGEGIDRNCESIRGHNETDGRYHGSRVTIQGINHHLLTVSC